MKKVFTLLTVFISVVSNAAGTIDFLEVDNDVVLFSTTEAKIGVRPNCVTEENEGLWSTSLASDSGRAMYSLILTAAASQGNMALTVESAGDCSVSSGYERVEKLNLVVASQALGANSSGRGFSIGVYQGDGETRVGTLIDIDDSNQVWTYIDDDPTRSVKSVSYEMPPRRTFYYSGENCQGTRFNNSSGIQSGESGGLFISEGESIGNRTYRSRWHSSLNSCDTYSSEKIHSNGTHLIVPYTDEVCGVDICVLKQDGNN
ncbi:hypothetical protein [Paraglaciecola sp.]|uniref:hypothetical protein n=1 Tax=Paraglaciecola sp. TaxID=1920173 RepID=UPI003EF96894